MQHVHMVGGIDISVDVRQHSFDVGIYDELVGNGVVLYRRKNHLGEVAVASHTNILCGDRSKTIEGIGCVNIIVIRKGVRIAAGCLADGRLYRCYSVGNTKGCTVEDDMLFVLYGYRNTVA